IPPGGARRGLGRKEVRAPPRRLDSHHRTLPCRLLPFHRRLFAPRRELPDHPVPAALLSRLHIYGDNVAFPNPAAAPGERPAGAPPPARRGTCHVIPVPSLA